VNQFQGKHQEAELLLKRALQVYEKCGSPCDSEVPSTMYGLAEVYSAEKRDAEAEPLYKSALASFEQAHDPLSGSMVPIVLSKLGAVYCRMGNFAEAERIYKQALAIQQEMEDTPTYSTNILMSLADLYQAQAKYEQAEQLYKRILAIQEKSVGQNHPDIATTLEKYAVVLHKTGRNAEARPLETQAEVIRSRQDEP
jgi:tetratricopeptide (TPR) repeat protein